MRGNVATLFLTVPIVQTAADGDFFLSGKKREGGEDIIAKSLMILYVNKNTRMYGENITVILIHYIVTTIFAECVMKTVHHA